MHHESCLNCHFVQTPHFATVVNIFPIYQPIRITYALAPTWLPMYCSSYGTDISIMHDTAPSAAVGLTTTEPTNWQVSKFFFLNFNCYQKPLEKIAKDQLTVRGPLARYVKLRVAHAPRMSGTFPPPPRVCDPDMHHGTCVTHGDGGYWPPLMRQSVGKRSRHSRRMHGGGVGVGWGWVWGGGWGWWLLDL